MLARRGVGIQSLIPQPTLFLGEGYRSKCPWETLTAQRFVCYVHASNLWPTADANHKPSQPTSASFLKLRNPEDLKCGVTHQLHPWLLLWRLWGGSQTQLQPSDGWKTIKLIYNKTAQNKTQTRRSSPERRQQQSHAQTQGPPWKAVLGYALHHERPGQGHVLHAALWAWRFCWDGLGCWSQNMKGLSWTDVCTRPCVK